MHRPQIPEILWIKLYAERIEVKILLVPMMPCAASSVPLAGTMVMFWFTGASDVDD